MPDECYSFIQLQRATCTHCTAGRANLVNAISLGEECNRFIEQIGLPVRWRSDGCEFGAGQRVPRGCYKARGRRGRDSAGTGRGAAHRC